MSIPDYISPIIGYRVWKWEKTGLKSLCGERWKPSQLLAARCRASVVVGPIAGRAEAVHDAHEPPQTKCTCGVYASKSLEQLLTTVYAKCGIHGEVYLWGTVVEHELGWRAQFAYPKTLFLPPDLIPSDTKEMESRLEALAAYSTDIFIVGGGQSIPLCWKGSGFDAAGLDYLIGKRTQYYARRQRDRTLMRGDRVAVLGRGIAVVEHVDSKWIFAAVWNKCELRIARKDIVWDERNMRWETDDSSVSQTKPKAMSSACNTDQTGGTHGLHKQPREKIGSLTVAIGKEKTVTINRLNDVTTVTTQDRTTGKFSSETFFGDSPFGK